MGGTVSKQELMAFGVVNPDGTYVNPDEWKTIPVGANTYVPYPPAVKWNLIAVLLCSYIAAAFEPSILEQNGSYLADAAVAPTSADGNDQASCFSTLLNFCR